MSHTRTPRPDLARLADPRTGLVSSMWQQFFEALDQTKMETYDVEWGGSTGTPSVGDGTLVGSYVRFGSLWLVKVTVTLGAGFVTSGTGDWTFSLPRAMSEVFLGVGWAREGTPVTNTLGAVHRSSTSTVVASMQGTGGYMGEAVPIAAPAAGDFYVLMMLAHE